MSETIELWQSSKNDLWYFQHLSSEGTVLFQSDGCSSKTQCIQQLKQIVPGVQEDQIQDRGAVISSNQRRNILPLERRVDLIARPL